MFAHVCKVCKTESCMSMWSSGLFLPTQDSVYGVTHHCLCLCVCVAALQALPRGGNESEWALPSPRCPRGLASVSVMHSRPAQTPLPSVLLLCHCRQPHQHPRRTPASGTYKHTSGPTVLGARQHTNVFSCNRVCRDLNESVIRDHVHSTTYADRELVRWGHPSTFVQHYTPAAVCVSLWLCYSVTYWSAVWTHTHIIHSPIHDTHTHTLPRRELIQSRSLPLHISRSSHRNGCTSSESFFSSYLCCSVINEHIPSVLKAKIFNFFFLTFFFHCQPVWSPLCSQVVLWNFNIGFVFLF